MLNRTMLLVVLLTAGTLVVYAQDNSAQGANNNSNGEQTVTGCLQKGQESKGYFLTSSEGKVWELTGNSLNFGEHVGHTVAVTGSEGRQPEAQEKKISGHENKEASGKEHGDIQVSSLKMVSDSCNK